MSGGLRLAGASAELWAALGCAAADPAAREYALRRALQLEPRSAFAWTALGRIYAEAGGADGRGAAADCYLQVRSDEGAPPLYQAARRCEQGPRAPRLHQAARSSVRAASDAWAETVGLQSGAASVDAERLQQLLKARLVAELPQCQCMCGQGC
jgi:hypothetical protein